MFPELLVILFITFFIVQVVRNAMRSGTDALTQGQRGTEGAAGKERLPAMVVHRPGPRSTPRVVQPQPAVRSSQRAPRVAGVSLEDWYLVLDVSPNATRREIQDAVKLRLSRARAERDSEAARRVLRAASTALGQAHRSRKQ